MNTNISTIIVLIILGAIVSFSLCVQYPTDPSCINTGQNQNCQGGFCPFVSTNPPLYAQFGPTTCAESSSTFCTDIDIASDPVISHLDIFVPFCGGRPTIKLTPSGGGSPVTIAPSDPLPPADLSKYCFLTGFTPDADYGNFRIDIGNFFPGSTVLDYQLCLEYEGGPYDSEKAGDIVVKAGLGYEAAANVLCVPKTDAGECIVTAPTGFKISGTVTFSACSTSGLSATVQLLDKDGNVIDSKTVTGSTVVDPNTATGTYQFDNVPAGDYSVNIVTPTNFEITSPSVVPVPITGLNADKSGVDFSLLQLRAISGRVLFDADFNLVLSAPDFGLVGVYITGSCTDGTTTINLDPNIQSIANGAWTSSSVNQFIPWNYDCSVLVDASKGNYKSVGTASDPTPIPVTGTDLCNSYVLLAELKPTLSCIGDCPLGCSMRSLGFYTQNCGTGNTKDKPTPTSLSILDAANLLSFTYGFGTSRIGACCASSSCGCSATAACCTCSALSAILGAGGGTFALQKQVITTEISLKRGGTLCDLTNSNSQVLDTILSTAHQMLSACLTSTFTAVTPGTGTCSAYSAAQIKQIADLLGAINKVPG